MDNTVQTLKFVSSKVWTIVHLFSVKTLNINSVKLSDIFASEQISVAEVPGGSLVRKVH